MSDVRSGSEFFTLLLSGSLSNPPESETPVSSPGGNHPNWGSGFSDSLDPNFSQKPMVNPNPDTQHKTLHCRTS